MPIQTADLLNMLEHPQQNVVKIPDDLNWDIAVSLPVTGLTPFHALMEASLRFNETLVVFGASGSTE